MQGLAGKRRMDITVKIMATCNRLLCDDLTPVEVFIWDGPFLQRPMLSYEFGFLFSSPLDESCRPTSFCAGHAISRGFCDFKSS